MPKMPNQIRGSISMSQRETAHAGTFYPSDKEQILTLFNRFNKLLDDANFKGFAKPKAIIVPHAGYVFSGFSANAVYANLPNEYERVIILGPSHRLYFKGVSVSDYTHYQTPFGPLDIDTSTVKELLARFTFCQFVEKAHQEHSTETQMPFIKHYLNGAKVVELIYGDVAPMQLLQLIQTLSDAKTLLVISSDLSHFYELKTANELDNHCLESIAHLDNSIASSGCEACGIRGIEAMIEYAKEHDLQSQIIDYRTSYDASGDSSSVVGYCSAIFKER